MNNKELATYFVSGRCGHGSNCQTDGTTFVSYDTAVAANHGKCILIACAYKARNWYGSFFGTTPTTERQKSYIKRAANTIGVAWYEVPNAFATTRKEHETNWQYLQGIYRKYESKAQNARKDSTYFNYLILSKSAKVTADNYWRIFCAE